MTRPTFDRPAAPRRGAAILAVAVALAGGVALIATSGAGTSRRGGTSRPHRVRAAPTPRSDVFPHTRAGAVAAATAWCQDTKVFFDGTWDSVPNALATGAFRARVDRLQPASEMIHNRLLALHTPYLPRTWPLGYAVQQYSPTSARVRVWQYYVLAVAGPEDETGFQTMTVSLQWTGGDWKVTGSSSGPDLAPPGRRATANQVAGWITSANQLRDYTYAP